MGFFLLDISSFIGRFHPVMVHLPIGFIIIAILLEWRLNDERHRGAIIYTWFLSGLFAAIASLCGWFLANDGAYDNWTLFFHRWTGILIAVISFIGWWIRRNNTTKNIYNKVTSAAVVVLLLIAGHLGGNMTHGPDYLLEYAPGPVQKLFGYNADPESFQEFTDPDSVNVYTHLLMPIVEKKCVSCHSDDVQNGGLNMSSKEALSQGGDNGPVVKGGDYKSEMLRRVTLPTTSSKFMPTSGLPLTYHEIKILEWWIAEGANFDAQASEMNYDESIQATLLTRHKLDLTPKPWIEKTKVSRIDSTIIKELQDLNWRVNQLAQNNGWIEIVLPHGSAVNDEMITQLHKAKEQLTWLNLKNSQLSDNHISDINQLTHLTKLYMQNNLITSEGLAQLTSLKRLESLNLVNTSVDDEVFELLDRFPELKNVYLWQSKVTDEGLEQARNKYQDINIVHAVM